ncbi:MAG: hypothetical protein ACRCYC_15130 [Paraclostridium sp.]|uniref:hypothetical protein n=1 Tax=Paraclostridium sp. TaxID=2023273 RepID=UPI003F395F0A
MKDKKEFTENILNKISMKTTKDKIFNNIEDNTNPFIMIPINHPNIEAIMKLLNFNSTDEDNKNIEEKRKIITLNDIKSRNTTTINIPKNSIITPMAKDYIKQYKIEIIFN